MLHAHQISSATTSDQDIARALDLHPERFEPDALRALGERFLALSEAYDSATETLIAWDIDPGDECPAWVTLDDFINSKQWDEYRESLYSNMAFYDPERYDRIIAAAEHGADGSTHRECIEDQRSGVEYMAESITLLPHNAEALLTELDHIESWHELNGTLDQEVG